MKQKINSILKRLQEKQEAVLLMRERLKNEIALLEKKIVDESNISGNDHSSVEVYKSYLTMYREKELKELIRDSNLRIKVLKLQYMIDEKNGLNDSELDFEKYKETTNGIYAVTRALIKSAAIIGTIKETDIERYNSYLVPDPQIKLMNSSSKEENNDGSSKLKKFARNELKEKLLIFIKDEKLKTGETVSSKKINKFVSQMENEGYRVTTNGIRARLGDMGYSKERE